MARIPTREEYRTRWAQLDRTERRAIVRAVNRGQELEDKRSAALAVRLARNQKAFWARAWLLGPLAALFTATQGVAVYVANALLSAGILAIMSLLWFRRADRAERRNLAKLTGQDEADVVTEQVRPFRSFVQRLPLPMSLRVRLAASEDGATTAPAEEPDAREQVPGVDFPTEPVKGPGHTPRSKRRRR